MPKTRQKTSKAKKEKELEIKYIPINVSREEVSRRISEALAPLFDDVA